MSRKSINDQIEEIENIVIDFPQYNNILLTIKNMLHILSTVDNTPNKGSIYSLDELNIEDLKNKSLESKKPIIEFLNYNYFNEGMYSKTLNELLIIFRNSDNEKGIDHLLDAIKLGEVDTKNGIRATLSGEPIWINEIADKYGLEYSLLRLVFETPLRPFFEELSRRLEKDFREVWWRPFCPICGRTSNIMRLHQRKRYMVCQFCGTEHLIDPFLCVHCGNTDPHSLGFAKFTNHDSIEVDFCEECRHYVKVILEIDNKLPLGLEDILTQEIDFLAMDKLALIQD